MDTQQGLHDDNQTPPLGPQVGDVIFPYRLVRLLGEGSAGRVYEVEHVKIGRRAAMKVLAPDHANRPGAVRRLFQEAKAVNRINHPHIVDVTDLIEASGPTGVNAIVMELLEGQSLAQAMLAQPHMPAQRILAILSQVAGALAAAHGAYFIHRDLKPENIFLVRRGHQTDVVKVLDFGLAKSFGSSEAKSSQGSYHTVEGTFVGTPAYTSPEQASAKTVDHRTDIYSLGVILYELLAGRLPFEGRNFGEFLVKHLTLPVPIIALSKLATPLERTLALVAYKCLEKSPADRYGSAADVKDVLDRLARGETVEVQVRLPTRANAFPKSRGAWINALLGIGGPLVVAVLLMALWPEKPEPPPTRPAAPSTVVFGFESEPMGAEVRLAGNSALLGLTPFRQEFQRDGRKHRFEMRLTGHATETFELEASVDTTANRRLSKLLPPPPELPPPLRAAAVKPGPKPKPRRSAYTVDPFSP